MLNTCLLRFSTCTSTNVSKSIRERQLHFNRSNINWLKHGLNESHLADTEYFSSSSSLSSCSNYEFKQQQYELEFLDLELQNASTQAAKCRIGHKQN